MQQEMSGSGGPLEPFAAIHKQCPWTAKATSERLGWTNVEAARYDLSSGSEVLSPAATYHRLVLVTRTAEEVDLEYEGVNRHRPLDMGAISLVPAGSPTWFRWSGRFAWNVVYLEPRVIERVAAEAFDLDPARLTIPSLDAVDLPQLRTVMETVDAELTAGGTGGPLAAESLANVLAVQLIRHIRAPRGRRSRKDGSLPPAMLRAVIEYLEAQLDANPTLGQMAAIAGLSPFHFARRFKRSTGLPPHQFVITRRIERAKELLQGDEDLSLARVASRVGFMDQSQLTHHFKRVVGVTPGQFRRR